MDETADPTAAIEALQKRFADCIAGRDFAALAGLFTEHALLLPPGRGITTGRDDIQQFWQEATGVESVTFRTENLDPLGADALREVGSLHIGLGGAGAGNQGGEIPGKYVFIWRKSGPDWKIETAIWNRVAASRPAPGRRRGGGGGMGMGRGRNRGPQRGAFVPLLD